MASEPGVKFTSDSADRIAKVVRIVEAGNRPGSPLDLPPRLQQLPYKLRLGTFTGDWQTGQYKVVTLQGSTNTTEVYNWCNPAVGSDTSSTTENRYVIFGRVNGTQSAVELQMQSTSQTCVSSIGGLKLEELPAYTPDQIQLLGHNESACLQWYSITTCGTATASV
jgi:hypothetical protein